MLWTESAYTRILTPSTLRNLCQIATEQRQLDRPPQVERAGADADVSTDGHVDV